jgi:hypothetical protein
MAGRNWRPQPGLYDARLQKSIYPIATDTTKHGDKQNKKRTKKRNNRVHKKNYKSKNYKLTGSKSPYNDCARGYREKSIPG